MPLLDYYIQKKIKDGDIKEFERLFLKYYEPLCRYADKILNDMDSAEDIVQEFFYNFWKNRETFSPRISLNAYLYHCIRNNSLHYLEHLAIRKNYAQQVMDDFQEMIPADLQTDAELHDLRKLVDATLQKMPARCSRVFCMNRFEGRKYREIAEILSISVKTVEADMGKALLMFRKTLKEFTGDEMRAIN